MRLKFQKRSALKFVSRIIPTKSEGKYLPSTRDGIWVSRVLGTLGFIPVIPVTVLCLFLYAVLISGCGNDLQTVNDIAHEYTAPVMSAKNIEVTFSDSGKVQAKLYSSLVNRYEGEDPSMEFPKGFKVFIYDSGMRVETTITGAWGKRLENIKMMEAKGNVVVRNEIKNQQLNTEHLFWDEKKGKIFSDVKSKITTPDKIFYVEGLESNESFSNYTFTHLTGEMTVRKDSI